MGIELVSVWEAFVFGNLDYDGHRDSYDKGSLPGVLVQGVMKGYT